jgi:uncharacterized protein (UPF0218 family)
MKIEYTLTPRLRIILKEPFGTLIEGTLQETSDKLKELAEAEKPPKLITVGDVVSQNLHEVGLYPQLSVFDYRSMRDQAMPKQATVEKTVYVRNPPGALTDEAVNAVKDALATDQHTHIVIEGEEDLVTLVAVLFAPEGSFVVYGQPYVGIVVAKATKERKEQVREFLNEMKVSKS